MPELINDNKAQQAQAQKKKKPIRNRFEWTIKEDENLLIACQNFQGNWGKISELVDKDSKECQKRWQSMKNNVNDQSQERSIENEDGVEWSREVDKQIVTYYKQYGSEWNLISKKIQGKTARQIRDRFSKVLEPKLKKSQSFSELEDVKLLDLYKTYPNSWKRIAQSFDRRDEKQIKKRYYELQERKKTQIRERKSRVFKPTIIETNDDYTKLTTDKIVSKMETLRIVSADHQQQRNYIHKFEDTTSTKQTDINSNVSESNRQSKYRVSTYGDDEIFSHNPEDHLFKMHNVDYTQRKLTGFVNPNNSCIMEDFQNSSNEMIRKSESQFSGSNQSHQRGNSIQSVWEVMHVLNKFDQQSSIQSRDSYLQSGSNSRMPSFLGSLFNRESNLTQERRSSNPSTSAFKVPASTSIKRMGFQDRTIGSNSLNMMSDQIQETDENNHYMNDSFEKMQLSDQQADVSMNKSDILIEQDS